MGHFFNFHVLCPEIIFLTNLMMMSDLEVEVDQAIFCITISQIVNINERQKRCVLHCKVGESRVQGRVNVALGLDMT